MAGTGIGYDDTMRLMAQRPITLTLVEPPAEETGVAGSAARGRTGRTTNSCRAAG